MNDCGGPIQIISQKAKECEMREIERSFQNY